MTPAGSQFSQFELLILLVHRFLWRKKWCGDTNIYIKVDKIWPGFIYTSEKLVIGTARLTEPITHIRYKTHGELYEGSRNPLFHFWPSLTELGVHTCSIPYWIRESSLCTFSVYTKGRFQNTGHCVHVCMCVLATAFVLWTTQGRKLHSVSLSSTKYSDIQKGDGL